MTDLDVAVVGTGADPDDPDFSGFAMAYHHADAYEALDACRLVGCADVVPENAAAFADEYGIPGEHVYEDHQAMLAGAEPDVVSVCVPPAAHAEIVVDCAKAGVDAIHCEKPVALTWGGAREMTAACEDAGTQLTFNHQRRFKPAWVEARELVADGAIGEIERVELAPPNLYDWGTHAVDFAGDLVGDQPAEWAIGQVDYREAQVWFGAHNENQAAGTWQYEDGTMGLISTGEGADLVPALLRVVGTEGVLDLEPGGYGSREEGPDLRWRTDGGEWETRSVEDAGFSATIAAAIEHVIGCLGTDEEPVLSARRARNGTEVIFGIWESARRRGRVDFPLEIDDNPLHAMVESGALDPAPGGED